MTYHIGPLTRHGCRLLDALHKADRSLRHACDRLIAEAAAGRALPPAAVWLVDNYVFLHAQAREVREALPPAYYKLLPRLEEGPLSGDPRAYAVALEILEHAQDGISVDGIAGFLESYQEHTPLTLAELWALGPLVKVALVLAIHAAAGGELGTADCETEVRRSIVALRALEMAAWRDVVEPISFVNRILSEDPAEAYARMDFQTRDAYRHVVEGVARRSGGTEAEVARIAVDLAAETARARGPSVREAHVGFYLTGEGQPRLHARTGFRPPVSYRARMVLYRFPNLFYLGAIATATAAILFAAWAALACPWWYLLLLSLPASQAALVVVNRFVHMTVPPRGLPRMDFSEGIPDDCRTFVVVPTLLLSRGEVERLLERLEIHYLANRDPNLAFALLTDFPDSPEPGGDRAVLDFAAAGIRALNRRHCRDGRCPFYLFHRPLEWNPSEGVWMGRERKRGKLNDFNALLLGENDAFEVKEGDLSTLGATRYVVTLDSDTQLPRDTARGLVATIAHPSNRAEIDPRSNTVCAGYGLLQPRVGISMESAGKSWLARIYSGQTGFDPYTTAVSDVYQDLHAHASFTGKGIYDLAAFHAVAGQRFPDNHLLSHDLIEGEHVRVGLVTHLEVIDDYPSTYESYSKRKHRWVRGDWQILDWLLTRVPDGSGRGVPNPLGLGSRWKIFDNLRRSLLEISLLALLIGGWFALPGGYVRATLAALALLLVPAYAELVFSLLRLPPPRFWAVYARETALHFVRAHADALLTITFLVHQSAVMTDAIVRTLWRRFVSHRRLLQWQTMAQAEASGARAMDIMKAYMIASPVLAVAVAIGLLHGRAELPAVVVMELWIAAPAVAMWVNTRPYQPGRAGADDAGFLRGAALRTWRYFTDFGGPRDNWIVPDNVQENPPAVASRTSPTNLGLQLAADFAAHDFGYITHQELAMRLDQVLGSMRAMERCRGHFYNWYDTRSLQPLPPLFLSTVDSGNLAAALIAVKQGCLAIANLPAIGPSTLAGLRDHCLRLRESLPAEARTPSLMRPLESLVRQLEYDPTDLFFWEGVLSEAEDLARRMQEPLERIIGDVEDIETSTAGEIRYWYDALRERVEIVLNDLRALAPWLAVPFETELRLYSGDSSMAELMAELVRVPRMGELPVHYGAIADAARRRLASDPPLHEATRAALGALLPELDAAAENVARLLHDFETQAQLVSRWVDEMDFAFLFHRKRKLLHIGYDAASEKLDPSYYDLLASEARAAVFVAIAKGDIPREAWFHLGRRLTACRGQCTLVSWSGTMFEYLMPCLFLNSYEGTLLDESLHAAVRVQRNYGREHNLPWGISEAAWSGRDHLLNYQYRPFGIVELAANPRAVDGPVVAPYASMLAAMVARTEAAANLRHLASNGLLQRYGFYESVDYSDGSPTVIRAFMAHHQAMGLIALANTLLSGSMRARFHADPLALSTEYLLQERLPALLEVEDDSWSGQRALPEQGTGGTMVFKHTLQDPIAGTQSNSA